MISSLFCFDIVINSVICILVIHDRCMYCLGVTKQQKVLNYKKNNIILNRLIAGFISFLLPKYNNLKNQDLFHGSQ